jgi:outer membrane beta-barrel protein
MRCAVFRWSVLMLVVGASSSTLRAQETTDSPEATEFSLEDLEGAKALEEAAEQQEEPPPVEGELVKTATDEGIDLTMQDRIKAVARKTFLKTGRFELQPNVMFTVNDPFIRSFAAGGRLSWHLNEAFAVELGGGYVPSFFVQQLEPIELLEDELALINADNRLAGLVDVGVTFSPLYGKMAVFGDSIIHFDGFVSGGVGAAVDNGVDFIHPAMNVGVGGRIFISEWLVLRADIRDYIYPQEKAGISTLQNLIFVSLGFGFYFPFGFEYQYEAARVNKNG